MKLILLGASGMVGMGVLREALADPGVTAVLAIGRRSCGVSQAKLEELLLPDLFDFTAHEVRLSGWDACIWTVGVTSLGKDEAAYAKVTEELTLLWATRTRRSGWALQPAARTRFRSPRRCASTSTISSS
jgi:putative NADH-flavin reductase